MEITIQQAITKHQENKPEDAERLYRKILKNHPNNLDANNNLGVLLNTLGRFDEAEVSYKKAIELKPDYAEAHCNLAIVQYVLRRLDEAETSYKKAIELKPDYAEAHYNLGILLYSDERFDEAETSYKKAIVLKPDFAITHNNLGNTLRDLGRLDEAEVSYKKAIVLKPDFFEAFYNLGDFYRNQGKFRKSIEIFYKALDIEPNHKEAYYKLINALENEVRFFSNQEFKKLNLSSKLISENLDVKKLVKKNIIIDEKVINSLNNLSKAINEKFGIFYTKARKEVNYSINNGPCGPFANEFYIQWNLRFYNQVKIAFVMNQVPFESKHVLIKLTNGDLFDGGLGVHKHNFYEEKNLKVIVMEKYDLEILNKYAWGLDRKYLHCHNFSKKELKSLIVKYLDNI
tara:strand:- start:294 stop:1496 length:1203 start_codon:yes stop_codon:yes gene_type:complete